MFTLLNHKKVISLPPCFKLSISPWTIMRICICYLIFRGKGETTVDLRVFSLSHTVDSYIYFPVITQEV